MTPLTHSGAWAEMIRAVPPWFFSTTAFIAGAIVGSFLNVCIHRMPRDESLVAPRSHCYSCGHVIRWFDNIPLISFFLLGGKCRDCGARFSIRYWLVELLTAILFVWIWRSFAPWEAAAYTILVCGLIVATFIDFEHYIIPDEITLGGVLVGAICSGIDPLLQDYHFVDWLNRTPWMNFPRAVPVLWSLAGAAIGWLTLRTVIEIGKQIFGIKKTVLPEPTNLILTPEGIATGEGLERWDEILSRPTDVLSFQGTGVHLGGKTWEQAMVRVDWRQIRVNDESFELSEMGEMRAMAQTIYVPREAMGLGDAKFLAAIGAFLGPPSICFVIPVAAILGSAVGLTAILIGQKQWGMKIPFGPYLALAALLWLAGGSTWFWSYLRIS